MADLVERTREEAPPEPPRTQPDRPRRNRWRRPLTIFLAIAAAFVVYAFAFEKTDVSLEEIESPTRREQLYRILRALAHPDLVTYDRDTVDIDLAFAIPCGPSVPGFAEADGIRVTANPPCAAPGEVVTVVGEGFEPDQQVEFFFIPKSAFNVNLPLGRVNADADGRVELQFEAPERIAEEPQILRARTSVPVGSWTNRVQVWTDTNENGVEDPETIPGEGVMGVHALSLPEFEVRSPGGVAILDKNRNVLDFVSWGGALEATTGPARGATATPLDADPTALADGQAVFRVGEPTNGTWTVGPASPDQINPGETPVRLDDDVIVNELDLTNGRYVEFAGEPGRSLDQMVMMFFDGADGTQYRTVPLSDLVELSPRISVNAIQTWDRIIETVMLALVATTAGTILAVPLSFIAARNLMRDITIPITNLSLIILAAPVGGLAGVWVSRGARWAAGGLDANLLILLLALAALPFLILLALRRAFPVEDATLPDLRERAVRNAMLLVASAVTMLLLFVFARFNIQLGGVLEERLGPFDFLGSFLVRIGEITELLVPVIAALIGAGFAAMAASKLGYWIRARVPVGPRRAIDIPLAIAAGVVMGLGVGAIVEWFAQFDNRTTTMVIPAVLGGVIGLYLVLRSLRKDEAGAGIVVYYAARTLFNTLRSIEPLVMAIIFVVWVGIGPFAGSLALALHTTAALAKLYSEQVESISPGPIEAIRSTGATRLQTVVYAVIPQILPPYVSFTMYRWDINVRMSTIIGFAGGGGIGFLLQQNINLLQYRQAAAQMLAIAIVVATMDYVSSRLRERIV